MSAPTPAGMSDDAKKDQGLWARLVSELLSFVPHDLRELLGLFLGIWLLILLPMILLFSFFALIRVLQEPKRAEVPCWQIQKVDNRVYRLNACTGEAVELPEPAARPPAARKK
jgi:hypothetical protein